MREAVLMRNIMLHGAPTHSMAHNVLPFSSCSVGLEDHLGPPLASGGPREKDDDG